MPPSPEQTVAFEYRRRFKFLSLILAGATWHDRLRACLGAAIGVGTTGLICSLLLGDDPHLPLLAAPMGASALLLFAVPASPMAQPWPIIGGNIISALAGLAVSRVVPEPALAAGLAVALAIGAMSLTRCLHPPGGAIALTAAIGSPMVAEYGLGFPLVPVGLNALVLTMLGWAFHRLLRHGYPHAATPPPTNPRGTNDPLPRHRVGFNEADIDAALADLGEAFDIDRDDLGRVLHRVELRALGRTHGGVSCADIMSRDVVHVGAGDRPERARHLLLAHGVRTLPVIDEQKTVIGLVGLRELARSGDDILALMSPASFAAPGQAALDLAGPLTDGQNHAVIIVDEDRHLLGVVTQTDLLSKLLQPAARD